VDMEKCNLCGICVHACLGNLDNLGVMTIQDKRLVINQPKCLGCSNCIGLCPQSALRMLNVDMLFDFEKRHDITSEKPYGNLFPEFRL
jgi:MinD superfamily P-loop ATPase